MKTSLSLCSSYDVSGVSGVSGLKIDPESNQELSQMSTPSLPTFITVLDLGYGIMSYEIEKKQYLLDLDDMERIKSYSKKFKFYHMDADYPCYHVNNKAVNLMEFLYIYRLPSVVYHFKNTNPNDLRRKNIEIYHALHPEVSEKYQVLYYQRGHYKTNGTEAYLMKNPIWLIRDKEEGDGGEPKEYYLMYCEGPENWIKLCPKSYQMLLNFEKDKNQ